MLGTRRRRNEPSRAGGVSQQFTRGGLYSSPTAGIHYVTKALNDEYQRLGGVGGTLGHPLDSTKTYAGGATQRFERGWLSWSAARGYLTATGVIAASYTALSGPADILGHPVGARMSGAGGGYSQEFQNGWLIWSSASSIDRIARPIGQYYFANGGSTTFGYPKESTRALADGVLEQEFAKVAPAVDKRGGGRAVLSPNVRHSEAPEPPGYAVRRVSPHHRRRRVHRRARRQAPSRTG